jgi:hypothetical protein
VNERAARIGRNEALFRGVNEEVEELNRTLSTPGEPTMHIVCECGDLSCVARLVVPLDTYERTRADARLFLIQPGHAADDVEDVVEEAPGYHVVRKRPGEPARIAAATDPRS